MTPHPIALRFTEDPARKVHFDGDFPHLVGQGQRSCTVISRMHPTVKTKGVMYGLTHSRSKFGVAAGSSVRLGRDDPPPPSDRSPLPRSLQEQSTSTEILFPAGWSGQRSCTVISRMHPTVQPTGVLCGLTHSRSKFGVAVGSSVPDGGQPVGAILAPSDGGLLCWGGTACPQWRTRSCRGTSGHTSGSD
jgi:hypothetical protein